MLRTVFIGSKNDFDEMLVHWLSRRSELVGVVWIQSSAWKRSWKGRIEFTWKRVLRRGVLSTINEALFYIYYHSLHSRNDQKKCRQNLLDPYWASYVRSPWTGDSIFTSDINSPSVLKFLQELDPDVGFAMCIHNYFGKALRKIPAHGILLLHEGITPEYKGLYSPFWTLYNLDFDRLGYTVLRMNDKYDAGEIFRQGNVIDVDPFRDSHDYIGHKAIVDSLRSLDLLLWEIETGTARPLIRSEANEGYYTYPGITDLIRQRIRLRRTRLGSHAN